MRAFRYDGAVILLLVLAQLTTAPEFQSGPGFQKNQSATSVDGTSHVSAEQAQTNGALRAMLEGVAGYGEGVKLLAGGQLAEGRAWFEKRGLKPGVATALYLEGMVDEAGGMLKGERGWAVGLVAEMALTSPQHVGVALEMVKREMEREPGVAAWPYYAARLDRDGDVKRRVELLERAAGLDAKGTRALLELARLETGEKAVKALEQAREREPGNAMIHYRLATAYRAAGQAEAARESMRKFRELQGK